MVSEAKEKLLEYRQIVIVDFFLFNLSELVGSIGCMVIGSFLKYGYNKDLYPLVKVPDWPNAIKLAGENMYEVVAYFCRNHIYSCSQFIRNIYYLCLSFSEISNFYPFFGMDAKKCSSCNCMCNLRIIYALLRVV